MAEEEKAVSEKVEDVYAGVESYGSMIAMFMQLSGGNPLIVFAGAEYMHTLLLALVRWGAITEDELKQVQALMNAKTAERKEELRRRQEGQVSNDEIWTVGI